MKKNNLTLAALLVASSTILPGGWLSKAAEYIADTTPDQTKHTLCLASKGAPYAALAAGGYFLGKRNATADVTKKLNAQHKPEVDSLSRELATAKGKLSQRVVWEYSVVKRDYKTPEGTITTLDVPCRRFKGYGRAGVSGEGLGSRALANIKNKIVTGSDDINETDYFLARATFQNRVQENELQPVKASEVADRI